VCRQPNSAGWAPAVGGPPLTVRVQIIMPEQHCSDPRYRGWVFTSATISATVVLGLHSMVAVEAAATPYIPAGRVVRFMYVMDGAGRFLHLAMDYLLTMIIMARQGPTLLDFQLELAPLHTFGPVMLAAAPTEPLASKSAVPKLSKPGDKSTAKGTVADNDGKATMVGKVAKWAKGATPALAKEVAPAKPVNEFIPAKEVRPAKRPKGAKRPEAVTMGATEVNSTPVTTTSSAVKGPTAADPARTKRVGKASKRGPATKGATEVPVAPTTKDTSAAKLTPPARGIPAAEGEQGTQAAQRLGSRTGTGTGPAHGQGLA